MPAAPYCFRLRGCPGTSIRFSTRFRRQESIRSYAWSIAVLLTATWIGNLAGSALLAVLFVIGGGGYVLKTGATLIFDVAAYKMNSEPAALVARAILCNWLVCLAVWMAARTNSDTAKCVLIFWCLFAFIASGFEHSVANMTLFTVALLAEHPGTITWSGMAHNLFWVTLGNAVSGAIVMACGYAQVAQTAARRT